MLLFKLVFLYYLSRDETQGEEIHKALVAGSLLCHWYKREIVG